MRNIARVIYCNMIPIVTFAWAVLSAAQSAVSQLYMPDIEITVAILIPKVARNEPITVFISVLRDKRIINAV
jgi:hypothetical protein